MVLFPYKWATMMNKLIRSWYFLIIPIAAVLTGPTPQEHKDDPTSIEGLLKSYELKCTKSVHSDSIENICKPILDGHPFKETDKLLLCYAYFDVVFQLCDKNVTKLSMEASTSKTACKSLNELYSEHTSTSELKELVKPFVVLVSDHNSCSKLCLADAIRTQTCLFLVKANQNLVSLVNSAADNIRHDTSNKKDLTKNSTQKNATRSNQSDQVNANDQSQNSLKAKTINVKELVQPNQLSSSNAKVLHPQVGTNNCETLPKGDTQVEANVACKPSVDVDEQTLNTFDDYAKSPTSENNKERQYIPAPEDEQSEPERPILNDDLLSERVGNELEQAPAGLKKDQSRTTAQGLSYEVKVNNNPEPNDNLEVNNNVEIVSMMDKNSGIQQAPPAANGNEEQSDVDIDNDPVDLHAQLDTNPYFAHTRKPMNDFKSAQFVEAEDSHLFVYLLCGMAVCVLGYIMVHNKNKLMACILEGRRGSGSRAGRRRHTASYRKLDCNIEEAITSTGRSDFSQVIY